MSTSPKSGKSPPMIDGIDNIIVKVVTSPIDDAAAAGCALSI
ncbi:MAG: hypothetical protein V4611_00720 [Patescibacteria group bacterium]